MHGSVLVAGVLAALTAGCAGFHVETDHDPTVAFSALETYAWMPRPTPDDPDPRIEGNTLLAGRIVRAVEDALAAEGLRPAAGEPADVLVTYHVDLEQRFRVDTTTYGYGAFGYYGHGPYHGYGGPAFATTTVREDQRGTLMIDLLDPDRMELVWRGSAEGRLYDADTPQARERRVREAVAAIMERYPPGAGD